MDDVDAWLVWLIIAGVLAGAEIVSIDLVLIMLAGGAAAASAAAAMGAPASVQVLVAIVVSTGLLVGVRPVAKRHLTAPSSIDNSAALVGRQAVVLEAVSAHGGMVKLNGGQWSARAFDQRQLIAAGATVTVMEINGATAVVWDGP
ncbi:MAG: NfeD family protein [Actinomycetota bacterium]|nr:NfeD family protein [Actinomycetota bacterium]